jgi:hypothetical protein
VEAATVTVLGHASIDHDYFLQRSRDDCFPRPVGQGRALTHGAPKQFVPVLLRPDGAFVEKQRNPA